MGMPEWPEQVEINLCMWIHSPTGGGLYTVTQISHKYRSSDKATDELITGCYAAVYIHLNKHR